MGAVGATAGWPWRWDWSRGRTPRSLGRIDRWPPQECNSYRGSLRGRRYRCWNTSSRRGQTVAPMKVPVAVDSNLLAAEQHRFAPRNSPECQVSLLANADSRWGVASGRSFADFNNRGLRSASVAGSDSQLAWLGNDPGFNHPKDHAPLNPSPLGDVDDPIHLEPRFEACSTRNLNRLRLGEQGERPP
jgi:hypothetical protein